MLSVFWVILTLVILYFSQKSLLHQFSYLVRHFGGSRKFLIILWSLIFLPGTVVHELSHFLFAILVGARTGKIEVFPEFLEGEDEHSDGSVALGYVQTQKLNIIQGVLVGLAPFIVGLCLLVYLGTLITSNYYLQNYQLLIFQVYFFFTVSNSFFPSNTDLTHVIPAAISLIVLVLTGWFFGIQFVFNLPLSFQNNLQTISIVLLGGSLLNLLISLFLHLPRRLIHR